MSEMAPPKRTSQLMSLLHMPITCGTGQISTKICCANKQHIYMSALLAYHIFVFHFTVRRKVIFKLIANMTIAVYFKLQQMLLEQLMDTIFGQFKCD